MKKKRYELVSGKSSKFWEIEVKGSSMTTTYGRIDTKGQRRVKNFSSAAEAKTAANRLIKEKIKKGYKAAKPGAGSRDAKATLLDELIAQRVTKQADQICKGNREQLLTILQSPWGSYIPVAKWWDPDLLSPRKLQSFWKKIHGNAAPRLLDLMTQPPASQDDLLKIAFINSRFCPKNNLKDLANSKNVKIRSAVASSPKCPPATLERLASDRSKNVIELAARNPNCPASTLKSLAASQNPADRVLAADNPNCPPGLIEELAMDKDTWVQENAIANPQLPVSMFEKLASSRYIDIRKAVAKSVKCPPRILKKLAIDKSGHVRKSVASNDNTPTEVIALLAKDTDKWVRENIACSDRTPIAALERLASDRSADIRLAVATNAKLPPRLLKNLAADKDRSVRMIVAMHPKLPLQSLRLLAKDKSYADKAGSVREQIARRDDCPPNVLEKLYLTWKDNVGQRRLSSLIVQNPNCSPDFLKQIAETCSSRGVRQQAKSRLKQIAATLSNQKKVLNTPASARRTIEKSTEEEQFRLAGLIHSYLTGKEPAVECPIADDYRNIFSVLGLLSLGARGNAIGAAARSKDPLKRMAAAIHPNASQSTLVSLLEDAESFIRSEASTRLAKSTQLIAVEPRF